MASVLDNSSTELYALGVEEVEPWVCEDTFENRALLRKAKLYWTQVQDEDGQPSGLVRVFSDEALAARRDTVWERRKPIMADPQDRYSEYVHPDEYPLDFDAPRWVQLRLRKWEQQGEEGIAEEDRQPFPVRCQTRRTDGTRCWNWVSNVRKAPYCKPHLGWSGDQELQNAHLARIKLLQSAPAAADMLEELALHASGEAVRLKASTEILDRIGVRGGIEIDQKIEVEQIDPARAIREKLERLADRALLGAPAGAITASEESVIDAEVVTDEP